MGIDRLLRALPLLGRDDVTLVIAGTGSLAGDLPRLAAELGLAERVLVGPVSDDSRLVDWYRAADLFVLPTTAYEGFGMATVEALASGTPVVGTAIGATPELLAPLDPRLVAPTADPDALAAAIGEALDFATTEESPPAAARTPTSATASAARSPPGRQRSRRPAGDRPPRCRGARPNFMKAAPVLEAAGRAGLSSALVHTGQHYDAELSDVFFAELGLPQPDAHLGVGSGTHAEQTARIMTAFEPELRRFEPGRRGRRRRRQLDARVLARRGQGALPDRPRRSRPPLPRLLHGGGDQPAPLRSPLHVPLHDEPRRARQPRGRGDLRTRASNSSGTR